MKLKITTSYAIKTILYLARNPGIITSKEICKAMNIPHSYEPKITRSLLGAGLIERFRGVKGGFQLKKNPKHITLYDIVETMEPEMFKENCMSECEQLQNDIKFVNKFYNGLQENITFYLKSVSIEGITKNM
jgi:Rrf2 family protein